MNVVWLVLCGFGRWCGSIRYNWLLVVKFVLNRGLSWFFWWRIWRVIRIFVVLLFVVGDKLIRVIIGCCVKICNSCLLVCWWFGCWMIMGMSRLFGFVNVFFSVFGWVLSCIVVLMMMFVWINCLCLFCIFGYCLWFVVMFICMFVVGEFCRIVW